MKARLIKVDGEVTEVKPKNGKYFLLTELQKYVGGYIQMVRTHDNKVMVVNEEGKLMDLPFNVVATKEYVHGSHDPICGDVLICSENQIK